MIHKGQRNREQKLKLIDNLEKSQIKLNKWLSKRNIILYVCNECGLQIKFEPKAGKKLNSPYMSYSYNNYIVWFENDENFKPFKNNYKNTNNIWSKYCNYICLNCGNGVEDIKNGCEKCENNNIVSGNELLRKPCPICGTALNDKITFNGYKTYSEKIDKIKDEWFNIYRERYGVKEHEQIHLTDEEKIENNRKMDLYQIYTMDYLYVLNNPYNVLRFEFRDAWLQGYSCILEWGDSIENKFILFGNFISPWIEKTIETEELEQILGLLHKYNFFKRRFFLDKYGLKLDGYTFGLEVKLDSEYRELCIWGIRKGILYDVGMLLLKISGKEFKDFYEYAW